jgi:PAS domain S-box-containing protein
MADASTWRGGYKAFMSWVTFIWALVIGACAIMALPHLLVGIRGRAWENLFFVLAALSVAGIACGELAIMHARSIEDIGWAQRWTHLPIFTLVVSIAGFVYFYFGTGRLWLGIAACLARFASLVINFAAPPNLNFREITGVRLFDFLGETVARPEGVISHWTRLGELSSLLLLIFVIDASLRLWRQGNVESQRRAAVLGGNITLFIILAAGLSALIHTGVLHTPYLISLPFLGVVLAMGFELSYDILRAAQTARQLRASEAALRESDTRMNLAAGAANLGLWVWDVQQNDIWITEKGRELFGFAESEPIDLGRFLGVVHQDDRARMEQLVQDAIARGGEYESEFRIVRGDGKTRWVAGYGRGELDEHGKPGCMRGVSQDITKRKMAEEALRESEGRFRTVADVAPVMIWMSGTDKEGVFFNKGWLEFTGRTVDQELGEGWLKGVHAEDLAHTRDVCSTAFGNRESFTVEYRLRRKDGEYRWLLDTGTPRFEPDGTFLGYIGSCIDIGERKQAELDQQLQSIELARVGRLALMGELAASLAHEVNNPLGAMVTNASAGQRLLSHGQLKTEELRELLADIVADGHRAREVIQGIRNMVRKGEASHALVDIQDVIRDLLRIVRADAIVRNVSLVAEVDANAGIVLADRVQLLQVLINLTMNAFEALTVIRADARRVVIRAEAVENGRICVSVRDTGPGFPDGIVDQLFEAFFSTKAEGTGMGLAIARSIIEAHGGTLSGENCAKGGALFTICLPEATEAKSQAA